MRSKVFFFIIFLSLILAIVVPNWAPGRGEVDFIRYWSSTRLMLTQNNPYDMDILRKLDLIPPEKMKDWKLVETWNPPWLLLILSPIGILPFEIAVPVWTFINTLLICLAMYITWSYYASPEDQKSLLVVLLLTFWYSNTLLTIQIGQISSILLISIVLGAYWMDRKKYFLAGLILALLTIKPHITYLALFTIFIWGLRHKQWKLFYGMAIMIMLSFLFVWIFVPGWLGFYLNTLQKLPLSNMSTSTFTSLVELLWGFSGFRYTAFFLLPLAIPLSQKVEKSNWLSTLNIALLVSVPFSLYGFSFDQIVFLPAIIEMVFWIRNHIISKPASQLLLIGLSIVYLSVILLRLIPGMIYTFMVIPSLFLLIIYFIAFWLKVNETKLHPA